MLFTDTYLIEPIQKALQKKGYITMTPIQEQSIPEILKGNDVFGIAQTGTGKTAAFTLPIIHLMHLHYEKNKNNVKKHSQIKTLILTPTRELASQISEQISEYGNFTHFKHATIFGGVAQSPQERILRNGVDIVIATPGRLLDLIKQNIIDLSDIEYLILDEADRMLDMGFINDIRKILRNLPKEKQTLFFSATMPQEIAKLSSQFLVKPKKIQITPESKTVELIKQEVYFINKKEKDLLLYDLIKDKSIESVLIFTRTKHKSDKIAKYLVSQNIAAASIHGNKNQNQRENALRDFKEKKIKALVATEIVARGIDISSITHVINYEIPNEAESYVHRIGRTARAGKSGIAYSFCDADERDYLRAIEKVTKQIIPVITNHQWHNEFAQNATGKDAKPLPKTQFHKKKKEENSKNKTTKNNNQKQKFSNKENFSKFSKNSFKKKYSRPKKTKF